MSDDPTTANLAIVALIVTAAVVMFVIAEVVLVLT